MRLWKLLLAVTVAAVALIAQDAQAARMFLTLDAGPLEASEIGGVPTITATDAGEYDVHVWIIPDADQRVTGMAYSIATNNPALLSAVGAAGTAGSSVVDNPPNSNGLNRWSNPVNGGLVNATRDPDGAGGPLPTESLLVDNARGAIVLGGAQGVGTLPVHNGDPGRDPSGAFHIGSLRVRVTGNAGTAGLYLRQGNSLITTANGAGTVTTATTQLFFGDSLTPTPAGANGRNRGDVMVSSDITLGADAVIQFGGPPARELLERVPVAGNTGPSVSRPGPNGDHIENIAYVPPTANGRGEFQNYVKSVVTYFLDLNTTNTSLADIAARIQSEESDEGLLLVRLLPGSNELSNGIDYDIEVQYSAIPGSNQLLDFDLSAVGATVSNLAVPEPSTFVIAGLGLLGLAVTRRRRAA